MLKNFKAKVQERIDKAISEGDIFHAYEIKANKIFNVVMIALLCLHLIILGANELGVTMMDQNMIRMAMIGIIIFDLVMISLNTFMYHDTKWLKWAMEGGLLIICAAFLIVIGTGGALAIMFPVIISVCYYDAGFTKAVSGMSLLTCIISAFGNAYKGMLNLNLYPVPAGTTIYVEDSLRNAITNMGIDRAAYVPKILFNDFTFRVILIYFPLAWLCIIVARRGREMINLQSAVTKKTARIETELNLATDIQSSMLPRVFPAFPEHNELELYAANVPAKEVGGDFYDYFKIDDDHIAIVMADVSGKGVGAALFMTIAKIVLKNQLLALVDPAKAMTTANAQLCENNDAGLFVTTWAGIYQISTNTLTYTNAGHNPPVIIKKDGTAEYIKGIDGVVLAIMDGTEYTERTIKLEKGDEIFLYTDGLTEATSKDEQLYGEEAMIKAVKYVSDKSVREQVNYMFGEANRFMIGTEQFDDITMLALRINE